MIFLGQGHARKKLSSESQKFLISSLLFHSLFFLSRSTMLSLCLSECPFLFPDSRAPPPSPFLQFIKMAPNSKVCFFLWRQKIIPIFSFRPLFISVAFGLRCHRRDAPTPTRRREHDKRRNVRRRSWCCRRWVGGGWWQARGSMC